MNNVFVGCVISVVHHLDFLTGKVASIAVVNKRANPKTNKCSMSSEIHYTKSEYNKDDDRKDHQSYTCPGNPGRHRFIVVVMRHVVFQSYQHPYEDHTRRYSLLLRGR
jgi:hypothetical protein